MMEGKGCKTNAANPVGGNAASMGKASAGGGGTASMGKTNNSPMGENKSSAETRAKNTGCNVKPSGGACGTGCRPTK